MKTRRVALIIFYDKNKILLQDREGISKIGAKIGYFGGGIEQGETPEQAVVRETKEELDLDLIDHKFIGIFENQVTPELYVIRYVFIAPLKDKLSKITLREGKRMFLMTLDEAAKVKSVKGDDLVLKKLKEIIQ